MDDLSGVRRIVPCTNLNIDDILNLESSRDLPDKLQISFCNDPTIGSYNHYHLSPNGIPRGIQRWYGLVYFIQIAGKPRIRPRQQSSSFEVLY